jgi:hypothetical protein
MDMNDVFLVSLRYFLNPRWVAGLGTFLIFEPDSPEALEQEHTHTVRFPVKVLSSEMDLAKSDPI